MTTKPEPDTQAHPRDCVCWPCWEEWDATWLRAIRYALERVDEQYRVAKSRRQWAEVRRLSGGGLDLLGGPIDRTLAGRHKADKAFLLATGFTFEHPFLANPPNPRHRLHERTERGCLDCLDESLWLDLVAPWTA